MKYWRKTLDQHCTKSPQYEIDVLTDMCKGCGLCVEFCPRQVLHESKEFNRKGYYPVYADKNNYCLNCGLCELICPEFAINVITLEEEKDHDR